MNVPSLNVDLWGKQGREGARGEAAPPSALIYQNRNNGIESFPYVIRDEFKSAQDKEAVDRLVNAVPSRLKKKMFALRLRVEWMVATYGVKGMRLVGSTRRVSGVCNERFSWAGGGGKLHRLKLVVLAGLLNIDSMDGRSFGTQSTARRCAGIL